MVDDNPLDYPLKSRVTPVSSEELVARLDERNSSRFHDWRVPLHVYRTLANNPKLLNAWLPLGGYLLFDNDIPGHDREILILRTARNCGSAYEWDQHTSLGRAEGLTEEDIVKIETCAPLHEWEKWQQTLLSAADELHNDACISESTWEKLSKRYDVKQLLAVPMLVGQYHMLAFMLRSAGVQAED